MRILFVANYQPDLQQSMRRYAEWLKKIIEEQGHKVTVIRPEPFFGKLNVANRSVKKYLGYIDKFLVFPRKLKRLAAGYDLTHVLDHSNSMYLRALRGRHSVITCHDLLAIRAARCEFSSTSTGWSGRILQRWILAGLRDAKHVICVSEKTRHDLERLAGLSGSRSSVIYHGLNWDYKPGAELRPRLIEQLAIQSSQPYVLHVGGNQWYKNRLGVLKIFEKFAREPENRAYRLIMVGKPWTAEMVSFVEENGLQNRVFKATDISNAELLELYCNAAAFLFPSIEEGFGWPVLEAQACGCPVITTGVPPITEVAGSAAVFIDPADVVGASRLLTKCLANSESLRVAGLKNLERFNGSRAASLYGSLYAKIVEEKCDC